MKTTGFNSGRCTTLLTDLYQLTMACGYWKSDSHHKEAVFNLFFRKQPFGGGFTIASGLQDAIEYLETLSFGEDELAYLATLQGNDGTALFEPGFLKYLKELEWSFEVEAVPEGTVVFPHEPLLRIRGPIIQCQIVETALLNLLNFQSLIATKAARVCLAAQGDPVFEFGLRRAQGVDGALAASRAAYVGGCVATSNVLAGKLFGIPVKGTHAHSWVMSFDSEEEAFDAYADALPNNAVLLVDTYDTLQGVRKAIATGRRLKAKGHALTGIHLDSGDLAYLSIQTRLLLNEAGFTDTKIVASNDLDEQTIVSLKQQGAAIDVWGVGTKLVTAYDQPALGGVYKLAAIREQGGQWQPRIKLSEQAAKTSNPGIQQVRRFRDKTGFIGDMIYNEDGSQEAGIVIVDPLDPTRRKRMGANLESEDLLIPVFRNGKLIYEIPPLEETRERVRVQLGSLNEGHKRFLHPHEYPVGLSPALHELRLRLILEARGEELIKSAA